MSVPKKFFIGSVVLFALVGLAACFKKGGLAKKQGSLETRSTEFVGEQDSKERGQQISEPLKRSTELLEPVQDRIANEEMDQIWRFFAIGKDRFPIVETVQYKSRVPWLKDRPAWVADYAAHYATSRHFIARSLNGKRDYSTQKVSAGDRFNVFSLNKNVTFHLAIDLSRCKMWFYYHDLDANERELIKTYRVGLGRLDSSAHFSSLTPKGRFLLGNNVGIYKPGMKGYFQGEEVEMVQVFGTRWIPFAEEVSGKGESPRGYGFHGVPWVFDEKTRAYRESVETIEKYESDGCIRLKRDDIEELYSIVITKPTIVDVVTDYKQLKCLQTVCDKIGI